MISSVLVANRGEIARRVFRTCRAMGLETVAVFSDPDRHAPFVAEADQAFALGGSAGTESYLRGDLILDAARRSGATAIHPGYGFLAENAEFARAVVDAGLTWIGPSPDAIARMGSKLESKRVVGEAGVPTLASVDLTGLADDAVEAAATEIGYPVLVKASAGGGGKGMRIVPDPSGLLDAVRGAEREAQSAFGDATVFLEKYLTDPRHVEIQVFGDLHGNLVSLHERECSIQRRHQKIVEEAPSPAVDSALRSRMGKAAVAVARAVDYVGAGTVEFLLAGDEFYFLEMNTRLQVEHPVTEAITGLDLVRLQLLVAMGEPLPPEALTPRLDGHAIEVRLYAEDPRHDFLPVAGRLSRFSIPASDGIRVDSGVESGSEISVFYDPMLAKVISHAPTRREAAMTLAAALRRAAIHGSITNRDLLVRVLNHPEFLAGDTDTGFLDRHDPAELGAPLPASEDLAEMALAAALAGHDERRASAAVLRSIPSGWRNNPTDPQIVSYDGPLGTVTVGYRFGRGGATVSIDGADAVEFDHRVAEDEVAIEIGGRRRTYRVARSGSETDVDGPAGHARFVEHDRYPSIRAVADAGSLRAPMPGKVVEVLVVEGESVKAGQILLIMEAMKMEHTLRAPAAGIVESVRAAAGDQVDADSALIVIREEDE
ncbi:MAG TPA: biotin carboxylase N-terminal domain-containing protein [Acidimicrobiia bacterium]|nr:biotin carboxylase N-terminal domain-containing protein [Acidimicrobiia bacterium]